MADDPKQILIVDRSEKIRGLLQAHLGSKGFVVEGVENGLEAAIHMRRSMPDLIIIDQDVAMGGIKTARVLRLHPSYQRIPILLTLEHQSQVSDLIAAGGKVNLKSYLTKPFSGSQLEEKVAAHVGAPLGEISVADMREELGKLTDLPVLQPAHRKMISLLSREDNEVDLPELIRTIEMDQGLTTGILKICHSAYYAYRGNSIEGATTFLGIDKIRRIVQASIIFNVFEVSTGKERTGEFNLLELWKHCIACGIVMEKGGQRVKGRDHFIAGMLHDIGKVVLYLRFRDHFDEILRMVEKENKSMYQAERELIGIAHTDIGYELARKWDLPSTIATSIAFHHDLSMALQHRRLTMLVHLSDMLTRRLGIGHPGDQQNIAMDPEAKSLAKYVLAVANKKDEIQAEVEGVIHGDAQRD